MAFLRAWRLACTFRKASCVMTELGLADIGFPHLYRAPPSNTEPSHWRRLPRVQHPADSKHDCSIGLDRSLVSFLDS